jgi:hypothetical protein
MAVRFKLRSYCYKGQDHPYPLHWRLKLRGKLIAVRNRNMFYHYWEFSDSSVVRPLACLPYWLYYVDLYNVSVDCGNSLLWGAYNNMLMRVAARCKAWSLVARSNVGAVGSSLTWGVDTYVRLFILCSGCRQTSWDGLILRPMNPTVYKK